MRLRLDFLASLTLCALTKALVGHPKAGKECVLQNMDLLSRIAFLTKALWPSEAAICILPRHSQIVCSG